MKKKNTQRLMHVLHIVVSCILHGTIANEEAKSQNKIRLRGNRKTSSVAESLALRKKQGKDLCLYDTITGVWNCGGRSGLTESSLDSPKLIGVNPSNPFTSSSFDPKLDVTDIPTTNSITSASSLPSYIHSTNPSTSSTTRSSSLPSITHTYIPSTSPIATASSQPSNSPLANSSSAVPSSASLSSSPLERNNTILDKSSETCEYSSVDLSSCLSSLTPETPKRLKRLYLGDFMCSNNKEYQLGMTLDGYLAICQSGVRVYEQGPFSGENPYVLFQNGGNFVVYDTDTANPTSLWSSKTGGNPTSTLRLDDNGSASIENLQGNTIWEIKPQPVKPVVLTSSPTSFPSISSVPTTNPTSSSAPSISSSPTSYTTYFPGNLTLDKNTGLLISQGLHIRLIAKSNQRVLYENGELSDIPFHKLPDAATCIPSRSGNRWHYLINSEVNGGDIAKGGVGQITFGPSGEVEHYDMVLRGTKMNCGGGKTPWNTFISCEEIRRKGQCWEIHPEQEWPVRATVMGENGGKYESAAFDARDMRALKGFVTHDDGDGEVRRFTPHDATLMRAIESGDYRDVLHTQGGLIEYLVLHPSINNTLGSGTYTWTTNIAEGKKSAAAYFPNTEGIDVHDGHLYFIAKKTKKMIVLDLDSNTYVSSSTKSGPFNGQPDQVMHILPTYPHVKSRAPGLIYFTEDGGGDGAGIFARDKDANQMYTIVKGGPGFTDETTGLAFCDDNKRMMFAFQDEGLVYEVVREDKLPFYGSTVDIKYHEKVFGVKLP